MIERKELLNDLKGLLKRLEKDLRERAEKQGDAPEVHRMLDEEYQKAKKAERTAASFEQWRAEQIVQKSAAWILSCVFVRFLEDNRLVDPPKIAGPGERLQLARDEHELYFRQFPTHSDRDYLLQVFEELGRLPGGEEIFGKHNAIHVFPGWLSGDAAGLLLAFFQKIDPETGKLVRDFSDENWDTRFLGDLYQDLSDAAKKKYALLQTPDFVEDLILDRTLKPALEDFGLNAPPVKNSQGEQIAPEGFRMIDPACGSGHFLLGAFDRIFERWLKKEPAANSRELAEKTFKSIYGVDLNPFAIAIARFRLLLKGMMACEIQNLENCPNFRLNLACGDSLLHGEEQLQLEFSFEGITHWYEMENKDSLKRILRQGVYHAVVANPPYPTPKDARQNQNVRKRYKSCYGKYALNVPFMERIFQLSVNGNESGFAGYTGQITANSFMKREFGKKLVNEFIPRWDLTHVLDTSGAYIPGHGTPTVIIFGRNRNPVKQTVRMAMGILGEPSTPQDPRKAKVWTSILKLIDTPGKESEYVSVLDVKREKISSHPWSLGGGGAVELKEMIQKPTTENIEKIADSVGVVAVTLEDSLFINDLSILKRSMIKKRETVAFIEGECCRDWGFQHIPYAIFPYDDKLKPNISHSTYVFLWPFRTGLKGRKMFRKTQIERGLKWYEYGMLIGKKYREPMSIAYGEISTHNHFVISNRKIIFNQTAPVIKLPKNVEKNLFFEILGLLNSSIACFWLKQVCHNKGSSVDNQHARQTTVPFENFYAFNGTRLKKFPFHTLNSLINIEKIQKRARETKNFLPEFISSLKNPTIQQLGVVRKNYHSGLKEMVFLQEEIDWSIYNTYDITDEDLSFGGEPINIELGERSFEIVMARKMAAGELETTWFTRHGSTPITELPVHWPEDYKNIVEKRMEAIEENPRTIGLIEQPEYKRRWNLEPWDSQLEKALKNWLLDRLESYFDFDGRMNDEKVPTAQIDIELITVARMADIAKADGEFMKAAELYRKRPDFDPAALVAELVENESAPLLPSCRYKPTGMDKRIAWERTWRLQRLEDDIDALFDLHRLSGIEGTDLPPALSDEIATLVEKTGLREVRIKMGEAEKRKSEEWIAERLRFILSFLQKRREEGKDENDPGLKLEMKRQTDLVKRHMIGDIVVPPTYKTKDFKSTVFWRLRGKLDVPKERWTSFPHCESEDRSLLVAWAGYDHLQMARAVVAHYVDIQEKTGGGEDPRLEILLACLCEILPWLKQWHNDVDPEFNERMGDFYEMFIADEAHRMGKTVEEIAKWTPPSKKGGKRKRK